MKRIFVPTVSAEDWRRLLAKPHHWKPGYSAMTLATCWEAAHPGFPAEVHHLLETANDPHLADLSILAALPEYQVELPGGARASQIDLLVIASNDSGLVVIAVEGKVDEDFGPSLADKRQEASVGQTLRLDFLQKMLGLREPPPDSLRYQLLHRSASAILTARAFHAHAAVMLVHSFSANRKWFDNFASFASLIASPVQPDRIVATRTVSEPAFFIGWCTGDRTFAAGDVAGLGTVLARQPLL